MNRWLSILVVAGILQIDAAAPAQGPQIVNRDGNISINANAVSLSRFFRLWDQATGMQSTVPPALANRRLSVHVKNLSVNDALHKALDGQPFGYALVEGRGVIVTPRAAGNAAAPSEPMQVENAPPAVEAIEPPPPPEVQRMKPEPAPPVIVPTPFGPIVSPNGVQQPIIQLPPVPGAPPPPPFFEPQKRPPPPAGAPNGPLENNLFGPISIHK